MACSDHPTYFDFLTDLSGKHLYDAIFCFYSDTLTGAVFTLMVFGALAIMYQSSSRSVSVGLVLVVMLGGVIVTQLPAVAGRVAVLAFMTIVPVAVLYIVHRVRPIR